jgi:hypothetical protein
MKMSRSGRLWAALICGAVFLVLAVAVGLRASGWDAPLRAKVFAGRTVEQRVAEIGPAARKRLEPHFGAAGLSYPPGRVVLVGLKEERRLDVYASAGDGEPLRFVRTYPVLAASGGPGPKLREGDRQVPEGVYAIESLNPNSRFHVSLRVGYPNAFDREMAARDGRDQLGGDIMIHGGAASVGCLAVGDEAAEALFVLAVDVDVDRVRVVLSPCDLRAAPRPVAAGAPAWAPKLYEQIRDALGELPERAVATGGATDVAGERE